VKQIHNLLHAPTRLHPRRLHAPSPARLVNLEHTNWVVKCSSPVAYRGVLSLALAAGLVSMAGLGTSAGHPRITTSLSWKADIQPILERRCVSCHRTGGIAPMSLESYESARPWARAIREEVLERRMPPTAIRSGAGLYENARTMSLGEMELLAAWVDGGAPSGEGPSLATPASAPVPGERDEVVPQIAWGRTVEGKRVVGEGAGLTERVQFALPTGWIGAWSLDAGGLAARAARLSLADGTLLGTWTPDEPPVRYPDGAALRIDRPTTVIADFTLIFAADEAERKAAKPQLRLLSRVDARHRIVRRTVREPSTAAETGETLVALRLELADPNARAEVIVSRKNGNHDFLMAMAPPGVPDPITYRLRTPLSLAPGDTIRVNSTASFALDLETTRVATASRSGRQ
jgi:hypothetical protein